MATVLIIDDNETIREGLVEVIRKMGATPLAAASGQAGLGLFDKHSVDFVITDLKMDGMDGVAVLKAIAERDYDCPTMIMTAFGTVETAVEAMKLGAFDFLQKPFSPEVVRLKVSRALEIREERRTRAKLASENAYLREEVEVRYGNMVGQAECMKKVFAVIDKVAATDSTVFIHGESGTGKELAAHAIHKQSKRAEEPFIKVNCGALSDTLLESELFGHEKGAFTGAVKRRLGRFELADGGTIFLDEIGDVSPSMQTKLLRVVQQQEFERVGGETTMKVNVRIISATNKDLKKEVEAGRFREDLFYRLHIVPLTIPALRERREDIAPLTKHFVEKLAPRTNPTVEGITDDALGRLLAYRWPGNVRELENAVEQALVFAEGKAITPTALPEFLRGEGDGEHLELPPESNTMALPDILEDLERQLILKAFKEASGVKTEAARRLGIKTSALYYKLDKYGIS